VALTSVGSFTLGEINIGLLAGIGLLNPLLLQLDLFLTGQFGLGPFMADLQAQFSAAISAQLQLSLSLSSPALAIQATIMALANLQASLALALSLGLPMVSLQVSAQISAMAALQASLALKLGGISALLAAGVAVKIPALRFVAQITAALSAGPVHLLSFTGDPLGLTGNEIAAAFAVGLGPDDPIPPSRIVSGVILVTEDPAVFAAMGGIIKIS
jgi:hypothetical protein